MARTDLLPLSQPPPLRRRETLPDLLGGQGIALTLGTAYVGWYDPDRALLVVPIDAEATGQQHLAGVPVHGQLLGWADRDYRERLGGLRHVATLATRRHRAVSLGTPVPWHAVRAFAAAGLLHGDGRYRRGDHALIPWAVWNGRVAVPPPAGVQLGLLP